MTSEFRSMWSGSVWDSKIGSISWKEMTIEKTHNRNRWCGCTDHWMQYETQPTDWFCHGCSCGCLLGNTIGKGSGRIVSTAIGTFLGTIAGSEIGKSMDRPPTVVYRTQSTAQFAYGVCADITNVGAKSSCKRGVADRLRAEQRRMERDAYNRGYGR